MTAAVPGPAAPDALAAALAPDLVAVIGYLTAPEPARPAVTDAAGPAPEVVKVRLSGERPASRRYSPSLRGACEVLDRSGPRPNRYDPGQRVYLTVRTGPAPAGPEPPRLTMRAAPALVAGAARNARPASHAPCAPVSVIGDQSCPPAPRTGRPALPRGR